ncbi:hypothetical protein D9757_002189 [Collybiopsis confluens]|uniref:HMG box domain-containing protein n=1 Tax=Collybiopsis confluens TaxID=2823264 RepID=A0A8H5HZV1_9AGAR|nr:hypothetical protein D9757_002189 [Collybiopsis confluens]
MPAYRNLNTFRSALRRSCRLSMQEPMRYDGTRAPSTRLLSSLLTLSLSDPLDEGFEVFDEAHVKYVKSESHSPVDSLFTDNTSPPPPPPPASPTPSPRPQPSPYCRPRSKPKADGHIPRPKNPFMCFRSHWCNLHCEPGVRYDHRVVSRLAGAEWNGYSEEQKMPFRLLAEEEKRRHAQMYPDYHYSPSTRSGRPKKKSSPSNARVEMAKCDAIVNQLFMDKRPTKITPRDSELIKSEALPTPELVPSLSLRTPSPVSIHDPLIGDYTLTYADNDFTAPSGVDGDLPVSYDFVYPEGEFVPLEQIPSLHLSSPEDVSEYKPFFATMSDAGQFPSLFFNAPDRQLGQPGPIQPFDADLGMPTFFGSAPAMPTGALFLSDRSHVQISLEKGHNMDDAFNKLWNECMQ